MIITYPIAVIGSFLWSFSPSDVREVHRFMCDDIRDEFDNWFK